MGSLLQPEILFNFCSKRHMLWHACHDGSCGVALRTCWSSTLSHPGALRRFPWRTVICLLPYLVRWKWWECGWVEKQRGPHYPCVFVFLNLLVCIHIPGRRRHVQVNLLQTSVLDCEGNLVTQYKQLSKLWVINTFFTSSIPKPDGEGELFKTLQTLYLIQQKFLKQLQIWITWEDFHRFLDPSTILLTQYLFVEPMILHFSRFPPLSPRFSI